MKAISFIITLSVLLISLYSCSRTQNQDIPSDEQLKQVYIHYTSKSQPDDAEYLSSTALVKRFYETKDWQPVWIDNDRFDHLVDQLLSSLNDIEQDGLHGSNYHVDFFNSQFLNKKSIDKRTLIKLDLLLTDAFLTHSNHLLRGQLHHENLYKDWGTVAHDEDVVLLLSEALSSGQIRRTLDSLRPVSSLYTGIKSALARYRQALSEDNLQIIPAGPTLELHDQDPRVAILKQKLSIFDGLINTPGDVFEPAVDEAVRRFQKRHGLEVDGKVGPETRAALNVPLKQRIRQLEINLKRTHWLPPEMSARYIIVNIADFSLKVIENNRPVLISRVIVGKRYHETPVFSKNMTYLVLSPYWNVPHSIAVNEILQKIREDAGYLDRIGMRVFERNNKNEINPADLNWEQLSKWDFPYRFRQDAGSKNALGKVKFIFPNQYNVYLHGTPTQNLFSRNVRDFSHGCIRVEAANDLAKYLLKGHPLWSDEAIDNAMNATKEKIVTLKTPIPVHILYFTAWVDNGVVQFRNDIYNRDNILFEALNRTKTQQEFKAN